MDDSQNYYITPPTLFLPTEGIRITFLGVNDKWVEDLGESLEETFSTIPMTFYHLEEKSQDNWQWIFHMSEISDLVMVNVAEASPIELLTAFNLIGNKVWFYVDKLEVDDDIKILLNTIGANVFNSEDQLHAMLRSFIGND
jgi:hypothetical protein